MKLSRRRFLQYSIGTFASLFIPPIEILDAAAEILPVPKATVALTRESLLKLYDNCLKEFYLSAIKAQFEQESVLCSIFLKNSKFESLEQGKNVRVKCNYGRWKGELSGQND